MEKESKILFTFEKRADIEKNRIIIPKFIIEKYGRNFYLNIYDDGSIKLVPIEKLNKKEN